MATKVRRIWTPEKKAEAIKYAEKHGNAEACRTFKINENQMYRWRKEYRSEILSEEFPIIKESPLRKDAGKEIERLREENQKLRSLIINQLLENI
jgi:transposase-like protein